MVEVRYVFSATDTLFYDLQSQYLGRVLGGIYALMFQNNKMIADMMIEVLKVEVNHVRIITEDRPRSDSPLAGIVIALEADGLRTRRLNIPSPIKNLHSF